MKQFCQTKIRKLSLVNCKYDTHSNSSEKKSKNQGKPKSFKRNLFTKGSSSEEEYMENALALGAEEGRDKLR